MKYGAMNFPIKPLPREVEEMGEMGFDYKEDSHLPICAGIIDFERIMRELKEAQYDETITLEVFSRDRDYLINQSIIVWTLETKSLLPPFTKGRNSPLWQRGIRGDFQKMSSQLWTH